MLRITEVTGLPSLLPLNRQRILTSKVKNACSRSSNISVLMKEGVFFTGKSGECRGGNKKGYGDQVSVVCSHDESGSVFFSQWDVNLQGVWLFKLQA